MRISDWSSDVCSSDLAGLFLIALVPEFWALCVGRALGGAGQGTLLVAVQAYALSVVGPSQRTRAAAVQVLGYNGGLIVGTGLGGLLARSEEHTSELQSLMRISYAVFCLKKNKPTKKN